jgi:hypothetical protein
MSSLDWVYRPPGYSPGYFQGCESQPRLGATAHSFITQNAIEYSSQFLSIGSFFFMGSRGPVLPGDCSTSQSVKSGMSVSISIFQGGTQKSQALLRFIKTYPGLTGADSGILLIVGRRFLEIAEFQDVRPGHVFGRHGCQAELLREDVSGRVSYLFRNVEILLSSVGDFPPFEILAFQSDVVNPIGTVDALHFHFY